MWLPFVGPGEMMTHPGYFSTYSSCQHPTILGTEAPPLFSLKHANRVASSVAPGRQDKRDLEAQPASERCLCEGVLWGCVLPSILKPLLLLFFPAYVILSSICQLFHVVWDNIAVFFPSPGILFSEAVTPTPPFPYPGTPCEQQMVKDEGVAVEVSQVWVGGLCCPQERKQFTFSQSSQFCTESSCFNLSPLCQQIGLW